MRSRKTIALTVGLVAALSSCGGDPGTGPSLNVADLPRTITLPVGSTAKVGRVKIRFVTVREDYRCPIDVICAWSGNAELEFAAGPAVGQGPEKQLLLNTDLEPQSGALLGLQFTVIALRPPRLSGRPTRGYRVDLRVSAVP